MIDSPRQDDELAKVEPSESSRQAVLGVRPRDQLRTIIEGLPDGIVVANAKGKILFSNPAAEKLFGRSASELLGEPFGYPLVVGETAEIDVIQRGGADTVFAELRIVETDWEGEDSFLISLRDVTDRKRAEDRARQLAEEREARLEAEAANQAKSAFLAIMSHELRTPLNALLGYSELLELGISGPLTDVQREQLARIRMSAQHLLGLVNELLDLSKVESGRLTVAAVKSEAREAIEAAVALVHPQAASRGLELKVVASGSPLSYIGDEERVRQILVNLLSNAVKFTSPGDTITVKAGSSTAPDRDARLQSGKAYIFARVIDTGPGIPEDKLAAIFDPFVQAESGTTRKKEGSGLGLTISRRLARLMGGDLTVQSVIGKGSTFTLWLPASDDFDRVVTATIEEDVEKERNIEGLVEAGHALTRELGPALQRIVQRIQSDAATNMAAGLRYSQIADHIGAFLADIASALVVIEEFDGKPSPLLADATEIQRLVSERHGAQRAALGWTESALRREFVIIREELETIVNKHFNQRHRLGEEALAIVARFLDQSEYLALRALEAAQTAGRNGV
jgi:signal transduction histidine kinase